MKITRNRLRRLIKEAMFSPRAARQSSKERMIRNMSPNLSRTGRGKIRANLSTMTPKQMQNLQTLINSDDEETSTLGQSYQDTLGDYSSPRSHLGYSSKDDIEEFDTVPPYIEYLIHELSDRGYQLTKFDSNYISFNKNHEDSYANEYVFNGPGSSKDDFTVEIYEKEEFYSLTGGPIPDYDTAEAMGHEDYDVRGIEAGYGIEDIHLIFSMVSDYLDQFNQENVEQAFRDYYGPNY